jgi:hypothetical protein
MCVLLRMYSVPPRLTKEPSVPPQQVIVCADAFVLESLAFPPEVPRLMAPDCALSLPGSMVTVAVPELEPATALTVTVVVMLPPLPSDFVGTPLGATYKPLAEINPMFWLPPAMPLTSQVTPLMEALNCWLPKFATVTALGDTVIEPDEPLVTVTVADANFEVSAMEVAVTVT